MRPNTPLFCCLGRQPDCKRQYDIAFFHRQWRGLNELIKKMTIAVLQSCSDNTVGLK